MPIQILPAIVRHGLAENPGNVERDAADKQEISGRKSWQCRAQCSRQAGKFLVENPGNVERNALDKPEIHKRGRTTEISTTPEPGREMDNNSIQ